MAITLVAIKGPGGVGLFPSDQVEAVLLREGHELYDATKHADPDLYQAKEDADTQKVRTAAAETAAVTADDAADTAVTEAAAAVDDAEEALNPE